MRTAFLSASLQYPMIFQKAFFVVLLVLRVLNRCDGYALVFGQV